MVPSVADDHVDVDRVLDERPEALLAAPQVRGQDLLLDRLLDAGGGSGGQPARRDREGRVEQGQQPERHGADDEQDVLAGLGDVRDDRRGVLVDLVGADDLAPVGRADRQVDRQELGRPGRVRRRSPRRSRPRTRWTTSPPKTSSQVVLDRELTAAQRRQVGEDDRAVLGPDLDPQDLAGRDQPLEVGVESDARRRSSGRPGPRS